MEEVVPFKGVQIEHLWEDADVLEVVARASNGDFSGKTAAYMGHGQISGAAAELADFPKDTSDKRDIVFGSLDPKYAGGGIRMEFICDHTGSIVVNVQIASGDHEERASFSIRVAAHEIDAFVKDLLKLEASRGKATLRSGTLQTRF